MGDSHAEKALICDHCGKTWRGHEICPDDGTWLNDDTIMERRGRKAEVQGRQQHVRFSDEATPPPRDFASGSSKFEDTDTPLPTAPPSIVEPGTRVGEYDIEAMIGEGAMGTVYRAVHPTIGKHVAIKVMTPRLFEEPEAVKRFVAEARTVATVRHPGIVDVFGFGRLDDGRMYLSMEWLDGVSLGTRLARGPIPLEEGFDIVRQISRALDAAHAKGIVHRDLKPENVFLQPVRDESSLVKLLDFGLAKFTQNDEAMVAKTKTGQLLGTPLYMSPEQCKSKGVDYRTDIYALGCICYQLFCGRVPFDADNIAELISAHLVAEPPKPRSLKPDLPEALDALLLKMLDKDPTKRPSLDEFRQAISSCSTRSSQPAASDGASSAATSAGSSDAAPESKKAATTSLLDRWPRWAWLVIALVVFAASLIAVFAS